MGYGESKYIGELLLEAGAEKSGVPAVICRVGQLAGPVKKGGVWSKQEWLPSVSTRSLLPQLHQQTIPYVKTCSPSGSGRHQYAQRADTIPNL